MVGSKTINLENILKRLSKKLPKFSDGRINYSTSSKAPVLTCFIKYQDQILLLKRSHKVSTYRGLWNTVAGYLDEIKSVKDKAYKELDEELNINRENILKTKLSHLYEFYDKNIQKTWIIFPAMVELRKKPAIKLNWEHTDYKWIKPEEINEYNIVPNLEITLEKVL